MPAVINLDPNEGSLSELASWIGSGKKYQGVPHFVAEELEHRTALSAMTRALLPPRNLSVSHIIAHASETPSLSTARTGFKLIQPDKLFSTNEPNKSTGYVIQHPIPPLAIITKLRDAAGQAMLDGKLSIKYWPAKDIYLPFEVLGCWYALLEFGRAKEAWIDAHGWLQLRDLVLDVPRVQRVLLQTAWHGLIPRLGRAASVSEMAELLSDVNRDRTHELFSPHAYHIIPSLSFSDELQNIGTRKEYPTTLLVTEATTIGQAIEHLDDSFDIRVFTVVYSEPLHWAAVAIQISGGRVQVKWGDSLNRKPDKKFVAGLRLWAKHYLPRKVFWIDSTLTCGLQSDGFSCGLAAVNALKANIFGHPLWTHKRRDILRAEEFLDVMEFCLDSQSEETPLLPLLVTPEPCDIPSPIQPTAPLPTPTSPSPLRPTSPLPIQVPSRASPETDIDCLDVTCGSLDPASPQSVIAIGLKRKHSLPPVATLPPPPKRPRHNPPPSTKPSKELSRSAGSKKVLNGKVLDGTFVVDENQWNRYIIKLREYDAHCVVSCEDPRRVRDVGCSYCGSVKIMAQPYCITQFKKHMKTCKGKNSNTSLHVQTLSTFFRASTPTKPPPRKSLPCSGLTADMDERIKTYVKRTQVRSAGGISEVILARELFALEYNALSVSQKRAVKLRKEQTDRWQVDHNGESIFSSNCEKLVSVPDNTESQNGQLPICDACKSLGSLRELHTALNRQLPDPKNRVAVPHRYQNPAVGRMYAENQGLINLLDENVPEQILFKRFAKLLANGQFDNKPSFLQMLDVMIINAERDAAGVGKQNIRYPPGFDEFCHVLQCISPQAYRTFRKYFCGRTERSFTKIRSLKPPTILGIGPHLHPLAINYINCYKYPHDGPLACSVDDTKLLPALRPYFDIKKQKWYLIGACDGPLEIADVDLLHQQIKDAKDSKAMKLRVWSLSIPLSGVPPLILTLLGISEKNSAQALARMEEQLLSVLLLPNVGAALNIVSLGSDGTVVEREARRQLIHSGFAREIIHEIPAPDPRIPLLKVQLLRIGKQTLAIIQDSKHCRKTCRNNIFSGARFLPLGRSFACYDQVHGMAFDNDWQSVMYARDVEKLDRQDDRAAARLFSAGNLEHAIRLKHYGLAILLFIFGELTDAYQSRSLTHHERIQMVLRCHYFIWLWKMYLSECGYPVSRYYLSQEADDIIAIIINGLLALILIHRDHLHTSFPLQPWSHGTETNEHIFGLLRQQIPDFTLLDTLRMVPKINVQLLAACRPEHQATEHSFKQTAAGYSHTYMDGTGINIAVLSVFPTDTEITAIAAVAREEAETLWEQLGYIPSYANIPGKVAVDDEDDEYDTDDEDNEDPSDNQVLDSALESASMLPVQNDEALNECGYAAAALAIGDLEKIDNLPSVDEDSLNLISGQLGLLLQVIAMQGPQQQQIVKQAIQDASGIQRAANEPEEHLHCDKVPEPLPLSSTPSFTISESDLSVLVLLRKNNQSHEIEKACRTPSLKSSMRTEETWTNQDKKKEEGSEKRMLARKIFEVIKTEDDQGTSTGLNRHHRWTTTIPLMTAGNAANAQAVAHSNANKILAKRKLAFRSLQRSAASDLATAKVDMLSRLKKGSFGVVVVGGELMVAQVITIYAKGNGKKAAHAWVADTDNLGLLSYVVVETWQPTLNRRHFRSNWHAPSAHLALPRYLHLPSRYFLRTIPTPSIRLSNNDALLELKSPADAEFRDLVAQTAGIMSALKQYSARKPS